MMALHLAIVALLLACGLAGAFARQGGGGGVVKTLVYGVSATACAVNLLAIVWFLSRLPGDVERPVLPVGLPWLAAHFRLDALAAFFLLIVNLLGCAASIYGIGYGAHEKEPWRVLPFFPVFLAGM